jgi:signal peptidase II
LVLDQASKFWLASSIPPGNSLPVTSWFALVHWLNTGGLWGSLQNLPAVPRILLFFILPLAGLAFLTWLFVKSRSRIELTVLAAVLGGALGNLLDRVRLGAVVDFLYFHLTDGRWGWPAFNVADACLSTGIVVLLIRALFTKDPKEACDAPDPL